MDAQEVYNVPIFELVTNTFCTEWSEDNQISLITEKGVHIFELQPNPLCPTPTAKFKRSFLYPTENLPADIFNSMVETVLNNCARDDMYSFLFETALTPKLPEKSEHIPRIVQVSWSSARLVEPSRCLLATVTSAGAIDLTLKLGKNWFSISNLSSVWRDEIKDEMEFDPDTCDPDCITADVFRRSGRRLLGTAVTWSPLLHDAEGFFSYLVSSYRSSEIAIWRVNRISELTATLNPLIKYRHKCESNEKITKILWITLKPKKFLILLGFFNGQISGIQIDETEGVLKENFVKDYEGYPDKMSISHFGIIERKNGDKIITVTKNCYFILFEIDSEGQILGRKHLRISGFTITGISLINDSEVFVSTQDARIYCINLNTENLTSKLISHDMKAMKVQYLGLARSPSGSIFLNVTSPNTIYDHLVCREPSNLQIFILNREGFDPWDKLNSSEENLNIYWECLETIRIRAARVTNAETLLPLVPEELDQSLSIHKLRIIMWLTLITEVVKKKRVIKKIDNVVGEISEAQPLIFLYTASFFIIKLSKKKKLTDDNRLSIHFLRLYLEVFLAGEEGDHNHENAAIIYAQEALRATSKLTLIEAEPCSLCGEILTELPWNASSCPQGHRLARCAVTLLQITSLKYRSCPVCGRIFHPSLDEDYDEVKCLYCDVHAIYDSRIVGVYERIDEKCRNLSARPPWDTPMLKLAEGMGESKKKKKKRKNSEGTVVVKENEDITETWQEL